VESFRSRTEISITGLDLVGNVKAFTGTVQSVQTGQEAYEDSPLLVTMIE
jgi:hypothetical protein